MGKICPHTIDGVLGRKYGLTPGFHIGCGMGETGNITMLIRRVQGEVPVCPDLIFPGQLRIDIMPASGKYLGRIRFR